MPPEASAQQQSAQQQQQQQGQQGQQQQAQQPANQGDQQQAQQQAQAPATYTLKLPDGSKLEQGDIDEVSAYAREKGLSNDQAQEVLNQRHGFYGKFEQRAKDTLTKAHQGWRDAVMKDPELGGDKFDETAKLAMLPVEKFMSPKLREMLRETGYGDHPELVRFLRNIGKAMSEDSGLTGAGSGAGAGSGSKDPATVLYGGTTG